jgi:hypothetical protein
MYTLVAQHAVGLLGLLFGILAAYISRADTSSPAVHRLAWTLTAIGFLLAGVSNLAQNAWGTWAMAEGPHAPVYHAFVRALPAGNYGRSLLKAALGLLLCLLPLLSRLPRRRTVAACAAVLLLMLPLGAVYGWREGALQRGVHFPTYSFFEIAELITVFSALFIAVLWGTMDRWFWTATAIYGFRQALNAMSLAAMVFPGSPARWSLSPLFVQIVGILSYSAMVWCAWKRYRLARRHQPVPPMVPGPRKEPSSFLH